MCENASFAKVSYVSKISEVPVNVFMFVLCVLSELTSRCR